MPGRLTRKLAKTSKNFLSILHTRFPSFLLPSGMVHKKYDDQSYFAVEKNSFLRFKAFSLILDPHIILTITLNMGIADKMRGQPSLYDL